MGQFAWVTLATNDSYALGALVVAFSLKKVNTTHQLAVLITPGVTPSMREKLQSVFNLVQEVNVLDSKDAANLALLSRPELGITFTKLHCWRLTQYEKCVFLDADTLVLQNSDELFEREELSAAPDVGWPDCFNSGVFVFRPNLDTFEKLTQFAVQKGSFDGGDQGLLNSFFANWAQSDNSRRLPFIYNTCSTACYSYLPAFKEFGENVKILHFIGQLKPWLINFDPVAKKPNPPQEYKHLTEFLDLWWGIFVNQVHPKLATDMGGLAGALAALKLGVARTPEQEAYENNCRRSYWEHGNIDYLGSTIQERTTEEVTTDGRQITKKIRTLEGTQYQEIEEWETTEVNGQKSIKHRIHTPKRQIVSNLTNPDKKPSPAAEAALKELVSKEIVIVPGHTKVEFDEETNTKTVTEKTTTGFQVTKIITFPDGRVKTQTTTFYDPISVPVGEDEYEEIEEEEEIIEEEDEGYPSTPAKKTNTSNVTKNTNENKEVTNVTKNNQKQVAKSSNVDEQTQISTQVKQVKQQQTTVVQKSTKTTSETHSQSTKTQQTQQSVKSIQTTENTQNTQNTQNTKNTQNTQQIVKKEDDNNKQVALPNQPRTTVVKKKLDSGEVVEIHTTVSEDGLSKSCRRIVTKPAEELEITDYEEIHEPAQLKTRKVSHQTTSQQVTEVTENVHGQVQQQKVKQQQVKEQIEEHVTKQTTKNVTDQKQTNVTTDQKQSKNVDTTTISTIDENHVLTQQEIEKLLEKQKNTSTKTIIKEITSLTVEQIEQIIEYTIIVKKTTKITIITEELFEELKKVQQVKITQQSTQQKNTQQTTQNVVLSQEQRDVQEAHLRQQLAEKKKNTDVDERFTKNENETTSIEKYDVTNMEKTFKTRNGDVVTRPDVLPGEKMTEEVRNFPGGVEYTWHKVRNDGSMSMSMRTFYDPVPISEEEAKKKPQAALASNVNSGLKK